MLKEDKHIILLNMKTVIKWNKDCIMLKSIWGNLIENKNTSILKPFFTMYFLTMIFGVNFT